MILIVIRNPYESLLLHFLQVLNIIGKVKNISITFSSIFNFDDLQLMSQTRTIPELMTHMHDHDANTQIEINQSLIIPIANKTTSNTSTGIDSCFSNKHNLHRLSITNGIWFEMQFLVRLSLARLYHSMAKRRSSLDVQTVDHTENETQTDIDSVWPWYHLPRYRFWLCSNKQLKDVFIKLSLSNIDQAHDVARTMMRDKRNFENIGEMTNHINITATKQKMKCWQSMIDQLIIDNQETISTAANPMKTKLPIVLMMIVIFIFAAISFWFQMIKFEIALMLICLGTLLFSVTTDLSSEWNQILFTMNTDGYWELNYNPNISNSMS